MKAKPIFRWFDLWVGVYVDVPGRRVFVFPVPCFGVELSPDGSLLRWLLDTPQRRQRIREIRSAIGYTRRLWPRWLPHLSDFELVIETCSRWGTEGTQYENRTSEARSYRIGFGSGKARLPAPLSRVSPGRFLDAHTLSEQADRVRCEVLCEEGHSVWSGLVCDVMQSILVDCPECEDLDTRSERTIAVDWRTLGEGEK